MSEQAMKRVPWGCPHRIQTSCGRLAELAQHLQVSVERERAAISRDIHDDVGGTLAAIKFDLAWLSRHAQTPDMQQRVIRAMEGVDQAIQASQRIVHDLRPAMLEHGLVDSLQWMTARFSERTGVPCTLRHPEGEVDLPSGVPLVVYRVAQESLTNIGKHAHAQHVVMDLTIGVGLLSLEISDDGCGLDCSAMDKMSGFGLRGMRERAATVGGWVEISSSKAGTTLLLSIPMKEPADAETQSPDGMREMASWVFRP